MKRFSAALLAAALLLSMAACGNTKNETVPEDDVLIDDITDSELPENDAPDELPETDAPAEQDAPADQDSPAVTPEADKPAENTTKPTPEAKPEKPADKPSQNAPAKDENKAPAVTPDAPAATPDNKPAEPAPAPEATPEVKPSEDAPSSEATVGQALLSDFKTRVSANASISAQTLAEALLTNSVIKFSGAAMPVEPGLLSGFDNAEITGFSEGVMFAPMIGSIPFVGYIFTLSDGTDGDAFTANLKENANPRWNICVEAEETVVYRSGSKVFFLMCPKTMSE